MGKQRPGEEYLKPVNRPKTSKNNRYMTPIEQISSQIDLYHNNLVGNSKKDVNLVSREKPHSRQFSRQKTQSFKNFRQKHDLHSIFNSLSNKLKLEEEPKKEKLHVFTNFDQLSSPNLKVPKSASSFHIINNGLHNLEVSPSKKVDDGDQLISKLMSRSQPSTPVKDAEN
jgi:hypothetical protein